MSGLRTFVIALTAVLLVAGVSVGSASAAPPSNDTEAEAIEIGPLPFTHSMDTSEATNDGPRFCTTQASVFYSFTPDVTGRVQVDLIGSGYDTTLGVYTRTDDGTVQPVTCNDDRFGFASGVRFRARVGVSYFLIVGQCCGHRGNGGGGPLVLTAGLVANVDLEYSIELTSGATDPATGLATLTGTVTCNKRSTVYREATLRQVRQQIFVARGFFSISAVCTPGSPYKWSAEVDTETGIAFGPGPAVIRTWYEFAYDGWRDAVSPDDLPSDDSITLQ